MLGPVASIVIACVRFSILDALGRYISVGKKEKRQLLEKGFARSHLAGGPTRSTSHEPPKRRAVCLYLRTSIITFKRLGPRHDCVLPLCAFKLCGEGVGLQLHRNIVLHCTTASGGGWRARARTILYKTAHNLLRLLEPYYSMLHVSCARKA